MRPGFMELMLTSFSYVTEPGLDLSCSSCLRHVSIKRSPCDSFGTDALSLPVFPGRPRRQECSHWHPLAQGLGHHSCGTPNSRPTFSGHLSFWAIAPLKCHLTCVETTPLDGTVSGAACLSLPFCLQPTGDIPGETPACRPEKPVGDRTVGLKQPSTLTCPSCGATRAGLGRWAGLAERAEHSFMTQQSPVPRVLPGLFSRGPSRVSSQPRTGV